MNTEFNIADLEKALAFIKANPMLGNDNSHKGSSALMTEQVFIAGANTLAVALADGLSEDEILKRIKMYSTAAAISVLVPNTGDDAAKMVSDIFNAVTEAVARD